jgi:hypothetical protein
MTLNIERGSFVCIVSQVFNLNDYEVCQIEAIVSKYYNDADRNWMVDKSKIFIDQVTLAALYWIRDSKLDMQKVKEFIELLYEDPVRIQHNIEVIPRMVETFKARYGKLQNIIITPSMALRIKFVFDGLVVPYDGVPCGQDVSIEEPDQKLIEKVAEELFS